MNLRIFFTAACLALLPSASLAQGGPETPAQDVQQHAEALLNKARQVSDIRSANAPAFRLKATFSFVGTDLETVEGTYTEVWVSNVQWRREISAKDWRRIEVGNRSKLWQSDNTKAYPERAAGLTGLMKIFPPATSTFEFESVVDGTDPNVAAECAITKAGRRNEKHGFCFDKHSGVLLEKVSPYIRRNGMLDYSCSYAKFQKFGDFWFPRHVACSEGPHRAIEVNITELSPEPSPDPALFTPLSGFVELANCLGKSEDPAVISKIDPLPPDGAGDSSDVWVSVLIDTKGVPQNLAVSRSGGKKFDEAALAGVRCWRFKPATCNGEAIPYETYVDIAFRILRH